VTCEMIQDCYWEADIALGSCAEDLAGLSLNATYGTVP
jgi:hypothetical protein